MGLPTSRLGAGGEGGEEDPGGGDAGFDRSGTPVPVIAPHYRGAFRPLVSLSAALASHHAAYVAGGGRPWKVARRSKRMAAKDKTRPSLITYDHRSPDEVRDQGAQLEPERQMKEEANVQARSILWAAFAVLLPFDAASAQTKVQSFERTAASDARTSVQTYYHLTPDCNQGGPIYCASSEATFARNAGNCT
jgi:hypothetical protein